MSAEPADEEQLTGAPRHGRGYAVVTGGTRGIGRAITLSLARSGYRVLAVYARDRPAARLLEEQSVAENLPVFCLRADLSREEGQDLVLSTVKEQSEKVDVIVHSAASGVHRRVEELSVKQLVWTFNINVFSIHRLLTELAPQLATGGRVIGITSRGSVQVGPHYAAVGSSKAALESLFRYYAQDLAPRAITVNLVCPGLVLTDALSAFPEREHRIETSLARTPTGRLTTPEDVAAVVDFLCSAAAGQIVGQTITVDGGKCLSS